MSKNLVPHFKNKGICLISRSAAFSRWARDQLHASPPDGLFERSADLFAVNYETFKWYKGVELALKLICPRCLFL